jgi:probable addiction module antidote protein
MTEIAKAADLNRESLYKARGEVGNPEFGTLMRVLDASGLSLSAHPALPKRKPRKRSVA